MDALIIETGNGGDVVLNGTDLTKVFGLENMVYLAMFGGNYEAVTQRKREVNEQAFDWWANSLVFPNNEAVQMNSLSEKALAEIPLTSFGRVKIEEAIKADLVYMEAFAGIRVDTQIIEDDNLKIFIFLDQPENESNPQFIFIWDGTNLFTENQPEYNPQNPLEAPYSLGYSTGYES